MKKTWRLVRRGKEINVLRDGNRFAAMDEKERFLSKIRKDGDCWIWTDCLTTYGYGKFTARGGKTEVAHRTAWRLFRGEIPGSLFCLHRCDTPACVNPDHLFLGTQLDNMRDMVVKGRIGVRGHHKNREKAAKITVETAREIKRRLLDGERAAFIARSLGVSSSIVYNIKGNRTWAGV